MNYLRNFFYNTSDIIIAVVIVLISAIVIWTRIDAVMSYSQTAQANAQITTGQAKDQANATTAEAISQGAATTTTGNTGKTSGAATTSPGGASSSTGSEVTFKISSGQTTAVIAQNLVSAELIADKTAFLSQVKASGADTKFKTGTFKIPKGSSFADIIKILTRS